MPSVRLNKLIAEAGLGPLRAKSVALTGFLDRALRGLFPEWAEVITPAEPGRRGCQLSVRLNRDAKNAFAALIAGGVICDWREPDVIRISPAPLYNTHGDVVRFVHAVESWRGEA